MIHLIFYYFFFLFLINYSEIRKNKLSIISESKDITPINFVDFKLGYDLRNEKNINNTENTEVMNRIYDSLYKKEILDILENEHISIYNKLHLINNLYDIRGFDLLNGGLLDNQDFDF
jgi:hypothetical protein